MQSQDSLNQPLLPELSHMLRANSHFQFCRTFLRMLRFSLRNRVRFLLTLLLLVASSLLIVYIPKLCGDLIDDIQATDDASRLWSMVAVVVLIGVLSTGKTYLLTMMSNETGKAVRAQCLKLILSLDQQALNQEQNAGLAGAAIMAAGMTEPITGQHLFLQAKIAFQFIIRCVVLFWISWRLALAIVWILPAMILFSALYISFYRAVAALKEENQNGQARYVELIVECCRLRQKEQAQLRALELLEDQGKRVEKREGLIFGLFMGLFYLVGYGGILAVMAQGSHLTKTQEITYGQFTAFVLYSVTMIDGLSEFKNQVNGTLNSLHKFDKLWALLDQTFTPPAGYQPNAKFQSLLAFDKVRLSLANPVTIPDFILKSGQTVTISLDKAEFQGGLVPVLRGVLPPDTGRAYLKDQLIYKLNLVKVKQTAYILSPKNVFYNLSIADNLTFFQQCSEQELSNAACRTQLDKEDFINGFATKVADFGKEFTQVQRARLEVCRALLAGAEVVVVWEAKGWSQFSAEVNRLLGRTGAGWGVLRVQQK